MTSELHDFEVLNRWSGRVQFTAKIAAEPSALLSIRMGLAVKWAISNRANLSGANLSGAAPSASPSPTSRP